MMRIKLKKKRAAGPPRDWYAIAIHGAGALVFVAFALAAVSGVPRLQARLAGARPAGPVQVEFEWPKNAGDGAKGSQPAGTWMTLDIQNGLIDLVRREVESNPDPFSAAALRGAGEALIRTGWFDRLAEVRREDGGIVRVSGVWRVPGAVVRYGGMDYLIARSGELLPPTYVPEKSGMTVILGATAGPPTIGGRPAFGVKWGGDGSGRDASDVQAGLQLANLIGTRPWREQVSAVDVSEYAGAHRLEMVTKWGSRIVWGGAPGEAVPGEKPASDKLARLDLLNLRYGRIDAGKRGVEVFGPFTLIDSTPSDHVAAGKAP